MGGKVLVPTSQHVRTLKAARLAADVLRGAHAGRRPHRRHWGDAAHQRHRRRRPAVRHRGADRRGVLPGPRRLRAGHRPRSGLRPLLPTSSGARRSTPDLDEAERSPPPSTRATRARCWPTTARRRSTGRGTWTTPPSPASRRSWGRWATGSSSSRWPGSTPSTPAMFELARGYAAEGMTAYVDSAGARVRHGGRRLHRHPPPARGRRRLLRPGRRRCRAGRPPRSPWKAPPKRSSSRASGQNACNSLCEAHD